MERREKLRQIGAFWGVFLGLAVCAYLAAGIVTTVVAEWRRPIPPLPEVKAVKSSRRFQREVSAIAARNLSGTEREQVQDLAAEAAQVEEAPSGEITKSQINARVIATVLFDHHAWNFALIEDGLRRKSFIGHVGEMLFPKNELFTVVGIEEERVLIQENGKPNTTFLYLIEAKRGSGSAAARCLSRRYYMLLLGLRL